MPPTPSAMSRASEPVGTVCRSARGGMFAHAHDAALAELALDLGDGGFEGFVPIHGGVLLSQAGVGNVARGVWTAPPLSRTLAYRMTEGSPNGAMFTFCSEKG